VVLFSELERLLEEELGGVEPELRQFARQIVDILNEFDENLCEQHLPDEDRRALQLMVLKALECHMRGLPPPNEEVKFWMRLLEPRVFLTEDAGLQ
jgi:hypothetical protein